MKIETSFEHHVVVGVLKIEFGVVVVVVVGVENGQVGKEIWKSVRMLDLLVVVGIVYEDEDYRELWNVVSF